MTAEERPDFRGGRNLAMKVPPHEFERVAGFYREVLGLEVVDEKAGAHVAFAFGAMRLWVDRVESVSQAELWLEINAEDTAAAYLESAGITRCAAIEKLPDGFGGFWILNPANIVHLVTTESESP